MPNTPHSSCGVSSACKSSGEWSGSMPEDLPDPVVDRVAAGQELQPGQTFVGIDVPPRGGVPHLLVEDGWGTVAVVAGIDQRPSDHFLVEALRLVAGVESTFIAGGDP